MISKNHRKAKLKRKAGVGNEVDEWHGRFHDSGLILPGSCPACFSGIHSDCYNWNLDGNACCCHKEEDSDDSAASGEFGGGSGKSTVDRIKEASSVTDVTSTGRKRAALAYPIEEGMICEWANLKRAGGGVTPIIGCAGAIATDRHHGPDKNTLNNTEGNVHRICHNCHNRWHSANDEYYGARPSGTEPFIPLDGNEWSGHNGSESATPEIIMRNEVFWRTPKNKRTQTYEEFRKELDAILQEEAGSS